MTDPIIIDGHQDIAWNYFNNRRDFRRSAREHRRRETDPVFLQRYGRCMVGLPEEIEGRVALTNGTIFVSPTWCRMYPDEIILYDTPTAKAPASLSIIISWRSYMSRLWWFSLKPTSTPSWVPGRTTKTLASASSGS